MADLSMLVSGIEPGPSNNVRLNIVAFASPDSGTLTFNVDVAFNALATTVNDAIKDAGIAAADDAGYTVGALDKKTLFGGALGL
jgi:hypothetical protein